MVGGWRGEGGGKWVVGSGWWEEGGRKRVLGGDMLLKQTGSNSFLQDFCAFTESEKSPFAISIYCR